MPEAYTHIRIARAAQQRAAQPVPSQNAFEMGAQGRTLCSPTRCFPATNPLT